ncbi:MAG TPA: S8 family peptidase, partial [Pyrinomonadaceae bacterium]
MDTSKRFTRATQLTALLLLAALVSSSLLNPTAGAQSLKGKVSKVQPGKGRPAGGWGRLTDKVSPELRSRSQGAARNGETVPVILRLKEKPTGQLNALLNRSGVHIKGDFESFNSMAVEVPADVVEELAAFEEIEVVTVDHEVKFQGFVEGATGARDMRARGGNGALKGKDMNIAVLDSGVDKTHHGVGNILFEKDFTGEGRTDDPYGHGTHVASIANGPSHISHGAYTGLAPDAKIINLRVLNSQGIGSSSNVLKALQWMLAPSDPAKPLGDKNHQKYRIRVVNLSIGAPAIDSYKNDPLCLAVRTLVDNGIVVVAAAGNDGTDATGRKFYGRIHSPGNEPSAITVGASNTLDTEARHDDVVTTYSSRGPTRSYQMINGVKVYDHVIKPDLVAPGNKLIAAEALNNAIVTSHGSLDVTPTSNPNHKVMLMSGTSMSTPTVAGAAALLLQANPKLTPNMVKMILMYTAQPLPGFNQFEQGAGQLNLEGAMRLARLVRQDLPTPTPVGTPLLTAAAPAPQSSVAGWTFNWGGGVILDQSFATGVNLITKYQAVYGLGVLLADGTVEANGVLLADAVLLSDGITISDSIV